ncbi:beta-glucosidase [Rhizobium rhizogenes]|uniref:beta-glucosidase n=1 Tax=Rhizobium rhizogenes TaxID=359 RepID=UPI0004D85AEC|nr:glycoside hydrolase family 3 C-terminal domain-containing protein [Rhizobium rhizogenes]KEA09372.1 beta-glucosidase [Rhizobium rhizogenes]MQB35016.1 beta-glucosidase [Rhizobium rhizogenes]NTF70699.1 beta-glucosidase [Rhizobium rhizogenes]NTI82601.1 beta-glucosidase [Rhizobium rhizogenes]NTJ24783.1 beta-glucosidase [Rhizobium rhizogenes]
MIDELLNKMTLEEQVSLLSGADFWTTVAVERLGIPKIKVTDGPNGARGGGSFVGGVSSACFPAAIGLGASWSPELIREMGVALAEEAKSKSARVLLAPTVNIQRSGLNGRNFECYSEDPHLTSELAVAYIEGVQSQGIAATIKHFVANESEIERDSISSDVDERALRELYLPPFEAAVKRASVMAVMTSYNRLNGTFTSEHPWLLQQVLRDEWGFDGIVMSDWFGSHSTIETINAGLDLEMPGPARDRGDKLVQAVMDGKVDAETVKAAARRILVLLERVGAFADSTMHDERAEDRPHHRALIRKLGAEGAVLLKNDGILPLSKSALERIAVLGPNAAEARVMGGGSAQINAHYKISPLEGIRATLAGANTISHSKGVQINRLTKLFTGPVSVDFFAGTECDGPALWHQEEVTGEFIWLNLPDTLDRLNFSARLTATFTPDENGEYVIGMTTAGYARLHLDGNLIIDTHEGWERGGNFLGAGNVEKRETIVLEAGRPYPVSIDFRTLDLSYGGLGFSAIRFGLERPLGDAELEEAVRQAQEADVAVVFAGREGEWDTEGRDLPDLSLPGRQGELIARIAAVNPRTIVVLQTGGPVAMPWLDEVSGVLQMWYPGQELGNAVADVLFGDVEPGGRLPQTFPKDLSDNSAFTDDPLTYPGRDGHVAYREGVYVGYRHHDKSDIAALFPFGFGLSYTSFEWGEPKVSSVEMGTEGISVDLTVVNTGDRAGSDLVQLYVCPLESGIDRPDKELRAFSKVCLDSNRAGGVHLTVMPRDLSYFDTDAKAFVAKAGQYELLIARNAEEIHRAIPISLAADYIEPVSKHR